MPACQVPLPRFDRLDTKAGCQGLSCARTHTQMLERPAAPISAESIGLPIQAEASGGRLLTVTLKIVLDGYDNRLIFNTEFTNHRPEKRIKRGGPNERHLTFVGVVRVTGTRVDVNNFLNMFPSNRICIRRNGEGREMHLNRFESIRVAVLLGTRKTSAPPLAHQYAHGPRETRDQVGRFR